MKKYGVEISAEAVIKAAEEARNKGYTHFSYGEMGCRPRHYPLTELGGQMRFITSKENRWLSFGSVVDPCYKGSTEEFVAGMTRRDALNSSQRAFVRWSNT